MNKSIICSARYCPNWGPWEAYRELWSNTKDADPNGIITNDGEIAHFYTVTTPKFVELAIIGEGTKVPNTETIGQFGEGLKLAALATIRAGGTFLVHTPEWTARYVIEMHPESTNDVLAIEKLSPGKKLTKGCLVEIFYPEANFNDFEKKFVSTDSFMLPSIDETQVTIFSKGVYICPLPDKAMHDYNINSLQLNRDRSVPSIYSVQLGFITTLGGMPRKELDKFTFNWLSEIAESHSRAEFENSAFKNYGHTEIIGSLERSFKELHGDNAVIKSKEDRANDYARLKGHTLVDLPDGMAARLANVLPAADEIFKREGTYQKVLFNDADVKAIYDKVRNIFQLPLEIKIQWYDGDGRIKIDGDTLWIPKSLGERPCEAVASMISALKSNHQPGSIQHCLETYKFMGTLIGEIYNLATPE